MFKRKLAKRILKNPTDCCNKIITKNDFYYEERKVYYDKECNPPLYVSLERKCSRCYHKQLDHNIRYAKFIETCEHPDQFVDMYYEMGDGYPIGCYKECRLCGNIF